jgi:anti-sigma factor RsiW
MKCKDVIDFLDDYVAMQLAPAQLAPFEAHLTACSECRAYLDSYRRTMALGRAAFDDAVPLAPVPDQLVQAILRARQGGVSGALE